MLNHTLARRRAAAADARTLADWARRHARTRLGRFASEAFSQGVPSGRRAATEILDTLPPP